MHQEHGRSVDTAEPAQKLARLDTGHPHVARTSLPCARRRLCDEPVRRIGADAGGRRLDQYRLRRRRLHRRQEGLFPFRRPYRDDDAVLVGRKNDRTARHRPARRRRRHGGGRPLQRGRARHQHEDRRRQGVGEGRLRVFDLAGAQGPRRQRALQVARRSQGHDGRHRLAGLGLGVLAQRGAQEGGPEVHRRQRRLHGLPGDARRLQEQRHRGRRHQRADGDARDQRRLCGARRQGDDLSGPADCRPSLRRWLHPEAGDRAEIHERLYPRAARLQHGPQGWQAGGARLG